MLDGPSLEAGQLGKRLLRPALHGARGAHERADILRRQRAQRAVRLRGGVSGVHGVANVAALNLPGNHPTHHDSGTTA